MWLHHLETETWLCPMCDQEYKRGFYRQDEPTISHPSSAVDSICYVCAAHIYDAFQKFVVSRQAAGLEIPKNAN